MNYNLMGGISSLTAGLTGSAGGSAASNAPASAAPASAGTRDTGLLPGILRSSGG